MNGWRQGSIRHNNLIAEVFELERLAQIAAAHQRHRCLQIVAGFTGHTH
ncbi:hypothetical protein SA15_3011 [Salmonella enterica subsp. enterica serovar Agona str. 15.H.03]|nr:hypothetical protein SA15_3011 [Salmonella enterica subsp. enterica serovar Agona str. 15.H.03]